ncbi:MAG TPA: hypothetical protein VMU30_03465 [Bacteroidota bacterium]|nr:hypothetical protein [Bacteroidota bacterium]
MIGKNALPQKDFSTPHTDTIYATSHSSEASVIFTGSLDRVLLGKDNNAGVEACMLIKFYSWPDSLVGAYITSASISLKTVYHFGDSTGILSFNMYSATGNWTGDSIAYNDSLFNYPTNYYNPSNPIAATALTSFDDSSWISINVPDTATLTRWFITSADSDNNFGLIFVPTNNSMIKGFYSFNSTDTVYPQLAVQYKKANGDTGTYIHAVGVAKYLTRANPALKSKFSIPNDSLSYIQNGIAYRSTFHFDSINNHFPSTILLHSAVIEVTLDPSSSFFNVNHAYLTDSLFAYFALSDSTVNSSSITLSTTYTNAQNQHVYRFSVNSYAQTWLKTPSLIKKIYIAGYNESLSFDRFALYGNNAALVSERPRLIITYSTSK